MEEDDGHGIVRLPYGNAWHGDEEIDQEIREKCQKAIDLIIRSQKVPKAKHNKADGDTLQIPGMRICQLQFGN